MGGCGCKGVGGLFDRCGEINGPSTAGATPRHAERTGTARETSKGRGGRDWGVGGGGGCGSDWPGTGFG